MSDAPGAFVHIVENPHTDEVTVAWSAYDAAVARDEALADEADRLGTKLEKAKSHLAGVEQAIAEAEAARHQRADEIAAAQANVDAVSAANPELAAAALDRRDREKAERIASIEAELARLKGN